MKKRGLLSNILYYDETLVINKIGELFERITFYLIVAIAIYTPLQVISVKTTQPSIITDACHKTFNFNFNIFFKV